MDPIALVTLSVASAALGGVLARIVLSRSLQHRIDDAAEQATEQQQANDELRRRAARLEALNHDLQALDQAKRDFLAMASHEVRTPITAIRGFSATLAKHWDELSDEDRIRSFDIIHRQTTRLWEVVNDLLIQSRIEAGSLESDLAPVHVRNVVDRAVNDSQLLPDEVVVACSDDLEVQVDREHLTRILVAFLTNARKYGRPPVTVAASMNMHDLVVRVSDAGPGVPEAFRDRLFEQFTQASTGSTRTASGTGLGLAVARGLARANGGDVWYEPTEVGARFGLRIRAKELPGGFTRVGARPPSSTSQSPASEPEPLSSAPGATS